MFKRKVQESDLALVLKSEKAVNQFPWSLKNFKDSLKNDHQAWLYIDDKDTLIGFVITQKIVDEIHLLNICVVPEYQGQGLGREILGHVINYAKEQLANIVLLEVRRSNYRAQRLYLNTGFNEVSIRKDYYPTESGREDAILMAMDLSFNSIFNEN